MYKFFNIKFTYFLFLEVLNVSTHKMIHSLRLSKFILPLHFLKNVVPKKMVLYHQSLSLNRSIVISRGLTQQRPQYEYNARTDTFHPIDSFPSDENNKENQKKNFSYFIKTTLRNICLLTGGIVWGSLIFIALFVDIKEEDLTELDVDLFKDSSNQARLLAFFDLAQTKTDLLSLFSLEKSKGENVVENAHIKGKAFLNALAEIKENSTVKENLGEPVQLCGYRAASKLDNMVQNFKRNVTDKDYKKNMWKVECIIEGTKGMALVHLKFERKDKTAPWTVTYLKVNQLDSSLHSLIEDRTRLT